MIGSIQARIGPNRVGPWGSCQPFADVLKLLVKEIIIPSSSNKFLFLLAPLLAVIPALAPGPSCRCGRASRSPTSTPGCCTCWRSRSLGVYGVILAGWAANSKYAFLGAMRARGADGRLRDRDGLRARRRRHGRGLAESRRDHRGAARRLFSYFFWWLLPLFVVYFISGVAETNRAPFDVVEGESEIVAGFHVEYSGMAFAVFFVAEYVNMILISALTSVFFFGGWLSPFEGYPLPGFLTAPGFHWLAIKIAFFLFCFLWFRATFPRYRYDQIMRLGWKVFIPVTLVWICGGRRARFYEVGRWSNEHGS